MKVLETIKQYTDIVWWVQSVCQGATRIKGSSEEANCRTVSNSIDAFRLGEFRTGRPEKFPSYSTLQIQHLGS